MIGGSTEGKSRTPKKLYPITPNTTITTDKTVASTGLFILTEDKLIMLFDHFSNFQSYFRAHLYNARYHQTITRFKAIGYLYLGIGAQVGCYKLCHSETIFVNKHLTTFQIRRYRFG